MTAKALTIDSVIPVGDPGCYVLYGHVPLGNAKALVEGYCRKQEGLLEEELKDLLPPRHTWMWVQDIPEDAQDSYYDRWYQEVPADTPNAQPFTLAAIRGEWGAEAP